MPLQITHPKVISFYQKNPSVNIEDVNLLMVNFMETVFLNSEKKEQENVQEIILRRLTDLESFFSNNNETSRNYSYYLKKQIDESKDEMKIMIRSLLDETKDNEMENTYVKIQEPLIKMMETKMNEISNQIQQPVCNKLTESEKRLMERIDNVHSLSNQNNTTTNNLTQSFTDYLNKLKHSSSLKGQYGENKLMMILENMFPQSILSNINFEKTANTKKSGDITLYRNETKPKILIENKVYESKKVPEEEVEKFIRDIDEQKCHGLMISQEKEISGKKNFQIDIHKNYILVYIDNVKYDQFKIGLAIDIIDILDNKLKPILNKEENTEYNKYEITTEILENINSEFQEFTKIKEEFYVLIQDEQKKLTKQLNKIQFPNLDLYLNSIFATSHKTSIKCDYCQREFKGRQPAKALARHLPSCKKKYEELNQLNVETLI